MPNWRRAFVPGGSLFFTVVTDQRARFLCDDAARQLLRNTLYRCQKRWPFQIIAIVLLQEHLHTIWTLPANDSGYSKRWAWIKKEFTKEWLAHGGMEQDLTAGRRRDGRRGVWQPKFWEHVLRDEHDFARHLDYTHYNPVKHGYVNCPAAWPWSSFHRWVRRGIYPHNWACPDDGWLGKTDFRDIEENVGE